MEGFRLPYPNYTWSISHHIRKVTEHIELAFHLLISAQLFGSEPDHADKITKYIIEQKLIPANIRDDRAQIWRDYQQILSELGLIVSTRYTSRQIVLTTVGKMWLGGMMGSRELLTTQALRYQYPNGQKFALPQALRRKLKESSQELPSRVEFDVSNGVLIKPAVLILRVLVELLEKDFPPALTSRECVAALMPIRQNKEWPIALAELIAIRKSGKAIATRVPRYIQEWFALLGATDLFVEEKMIGGRSESRIRLSDVAIANKEDILRLCEFHENEENFWLPPLGTSRNSLGISWFAYYGTPALSNQWMMPENLLTSDYIMENYLGGFDTLEEEPTMDYQEWSETINPQPFSPSKTTITTSNIVPSARSIDNFVQGFVKRQAKALLHDQIVDLVARRLLHAGFEVREDRKSVDLLALKNNYESILEIKTVTPRNLKQQFRYGIGQLAEYRYKRQMQNGERPSGILVLSSSPQFSWIPDFLENDLKLGLVSLAPEEEFVAHTEGEIESILASQK